MRAMTFNILMGGGTADRFERICQTIAGARPDVLVLQECLGWEHGDRLAQVAAAAALAHTYLGSARPRGSGRSFHVALLSRLPIRDVQLYNDPQIVGHCVIEARLDWAGTPLRLLATHLDSHGEDQRMVEAELLCARMPDGPGLLLGDLNALSPRDPYPPDLADRLQRGGVDKYGCPLRHDVIDALETAGWIDTLHAHPPSRWVTAPRNRGGVRFDSRTDYAFVTPALGDRIVGTEIIDIEMPAVSDHAPVVVTLR